MPHSSILGRLLFLWYVNDMPSSVNCMLLQNADDSTRALVVSDKNPYYIGQLLSSNLDHHHPSAAEQATTRLLHALRSLISVVIWSALYCLLHTPTTVECRLNKMCVGVLVPCCHEVGCRVHISVDRLYWQAYLLEDGGYAQETSSGDFEHGG